MLFGLLLVLQYYLWYRLWLLIVKKLIQVEGSNVIGRCAEPKCAFVAKNNPSRIIGFAILWRGRGANPYPLAQKELKDRGLSSNQMYSVLLVKQVSRLMKNI